MSQQILDIYTVDSLQISESVFHSADTSWLTQNHQSAFPISPIDSDITDVQAQSYWRPSDALRRTLRTLYEKDYAQFPCIPCSYCSRLLYPHSVK